MGLDPIAAYTAYSAAWNQADPEARKELVARSWSDDGVLVDPDTPEGVVGADSLVGYIVGVHEEMPGLVIAETSAPEVLGNRLRVRWVARQGDTQMYTGTDFVEFAVDGRVSRVTMFYDSTPES
jgi:SnoaL-like domain